MNDTQEAQARSPFSDACIQALAQAVQKLHSGDQAQLRRMADHQTPPPVFYRLLLRYIPTAWSGPEYEKQWQTVLQGMSIMALSMSSGPVHVHGQSPGKVFGAVLNESGESRFWRLLEAEDSLFFDLMRHTVRMLASAGRPVDWADVARLCLLPFGGKARQTVQRRLARDFITAHDSHKRQGASS